MITISNALFAIIVVVSFWIGFAFCSLVCINGFTQPEDEARQDESHSATRYEEHQMDTQVIAQTAGGGWEWTDKKDAEVAPGGGYWVQRARPEDKKK